MDFSAFFAAAPGLGVAFLFGPRRGTHPFLDVRLIWVRRRGAWRLLVEQEVPAPMTHSYFNASIGSMRAARNAGTKPEKAAAAASASVARARLSGSDGATP